MLPWSAVGSFGFPFTNCTYSVSWLFLVSRPWPPAGDGNKVNSWVKLEAQRTFTDLLSSTLMGKTDLTGEKLVYFQWVERLMMITNHFTCPPSCLLPWLLPHPSGTGAGNGSDGHPTTAPVFSPFLPTPSPCPAGMSPHHRGLSDGSPESPTAPRHRQPKQHLYFKRHFYKFCIHPTALGSISSLRYRGDINRRGLIYWSTWPLLWVLHRTRSVSAALLPARARWEMKIHHCSSQKVHQ